MQKGKATILSPLSGSLNFLQSRRENGGRDRNRFVQAGNDEAGNLSEHCMGMNVVFLHDDYDRLSPSISPGDFHDGADRYLASSDKVDKNHVATHDIHPVAAGNSLLATQWMLLIRILDVLLVGKIFLPTHWGHGLDMWRELACNMLTPISAFAVRNARDWPNAYSRNSFIFCLLSLKGANITILRLTKFGYLCQHQKQKRNSLESLP